MPLHAESPPLFRLFDFGLFRLWLNTPFCVGLFRLWLNTPFCVGLFRLWLNTPSVRATRAFLYASAHSPLYASSSCKFHGQIQAVADASRFSSCEKAPCLIINGISRFGSAVKEIYVTRFVYLPASRVVKSR